MRYRVKWTATIAASTLAASAPLVSPGHDAPASEAASEHVTSRIQKPRLRMRIVPPPVRPQEPSKEPKPRLRLETPPGFPEPAPEPEDVEDDGATDQEIQMALLHKAAEAKAKYHELCRNDIDAFCEYVLKDVDGKAIEQNAFHEQLQRDLTAHRQIVVISHPESGKTSQIAVGRVLFELGRNPNLRVMLLYNAEEAAVNTLSTIKKYIEDSEELHAVFPNLRRGTIWKDDAIVVQRSAYDRNPSIVAVGYNSRRIGGSRVDFLVIDDLLDQTVTASEMQRRKLSSWVKSTVLTRITAHAMIAFLTNAWHPRDLAHESVKDRGWHLIKRPIRNPDGAISWHLWTEERLKLKRKDLGALEYARSFECDPRDDSSRVFRPEHVEYAQKKRGAGYGFLHSLDIMPDRSLVVTGIDLAAGDDTKKIGARTAIVSVFFHPNQDRQVVRIRSGRWRARQILDEVAAVGHLFPRNHWIVVENNGVQRWILDLANEHDMDVGVALVPFRTGRNKSDPRFGVASMAAEYEARRWILPDACETEDEQNEVESVVSQMIDYVPEAHTGDALMAKWFAREVGRKIFMRFFGPGATGGSIVRAIG